MLWLHADSPDDAGAAPAIADELSRLRGARFRTLVTTASSGSLVPSVAQQVIHQLAPGETSGSVARFLDHWHPDAAVILGVPDRPNLLLAAHEREIPLFLAASTRGSLASRRRLSMISADLLGCFTACLAASAADAEVLYRHLDDTIRAEVTGPLSDTAFAPRCSETERDLVAKALKGRPVWLAADITETELPMVEAAHRRAFRFAHRLLLVIITSDAERGALFASALEQKGWGVSRSSIDGEPADTDQVFIADSGEEHGLWLRLAPTTFVGGTLDPNGTASDPFAPASLGSAVLHGPNVGATAARFRKLSEAKASVLVANSDELGEAVQRLLSPDKAAELAQAGWQVTTEGAHVTERLAELISETLDQKEDR